MEKKNIKADCYTEIFETKHNLWLDQQKPIDI